ncbi:MAG: fibronectin type III domain-containing protein [Desulfuromonadales bacterium]
MKYCLQNAMIFSAVFLFLLLCSCGGDSPWRYSTAAPDQPVGLAATSGNGQISLSWSSTGNAAAYNIYYSTSPGVTKTNGNKITYVVSTSHIQTGLNNNVTYYFVVTSVNSSGESAESLQVSATPAVPATFVQGDLEGTWNFNILVSGTGAGWMRGIVAVNTTGVVTFSSFLDSAGNSSPLTNLFTSLFLGSDGSVSDAGVGSSKFRGTLATNKKMIVGHSSMNSTSQLIAVLQKQIPGIMFTNSGDIQGFGNTGGGGRRFIYNQISSGPNQEWEFAEGQIGKDQKIQYTTFIAPSNPVKPGDKSSVLNITSDGMVTESLTGASPQPAAVIDKGVMSADKSLIIGTGTDTSGTGPRYILRIYQMVNIIFSDPGTFTQADLAGTYNFRELLVGTGARSASGSYAINASGSAAYSSFTDSGGSAALPAGFSLVIDANGKLVNLTDSTVLGKFSYFRDMFVVTKTYSPGVYSLSIALKR